MAENCVESSSGNQVCKLQYCFTWIMYNFSKCPSDVGERLTSPECRTAALGDVVWHLHVFPKGEISTPSHVGLYLEQKAEEHKEHTVAFKFSILNNMREPCHIASRRKIFKGTCTKGIAKFIDRAYLIPDSPLLQKDMLTFQCDMSVSFDVKPSESAEHAQQMLKLTPRYSNLATFSDNLMYLHSDSNTIADFKLCVGEKEFLVHRNILSAKSLVFAALFEQENSIDRFDFQQVDESMLTLFIQYLYSGQMEGLTIDTALGLYTASYTYAMQELRASCSEFLASNLNVEDVCDVLILSDLYLDEKLKSVAKHFIKSNLATFLMNDNWSNHLKTIPRLYTEILQIMIE